ncbi:unnamed protein product [Psylliodes chrysocephalus]|uniref:Envelope fusion protein n=1 Tax=Psylliodes chrysocephalus TaxID=3402493 RepID=A0A9P0CNS1_9CUCU|nr:unnamed protein product [Psylliodes chrysocephala]
MHFIIILALCTFGMGQKVQITNLQNNPGILPVYQGQAKIQTSRHDFIHYYPLQPIADEIASIEQEYMVVTRAIQNSTYKYSRDLVNFDQALRYQLRSVKEKFSSISPFSRPKRGLIDGLGSVIKSITGNLDQEDAKYYNKAIKTLAENEKNIVSQLNHHISLNTRVMEKFQETISLITHNQDKIANEINEIKQKIDYINFNFSQYLQTKNVVDQLNIILQIILQLLNDLEEAVNLAKINILHNSLIKEKELRWIITSMLEHHSKDQLLYSKQQDFHKYYSIIEVDAYYTNNTIVFILHIPIIHPNPFSYYHLFSIPTQNHSTIIPYASYLLTNPALFQYNELPCKKLGQEFLCEKKLLLDVSGSEDCIIQILQIENEAASCENVPVVLNSTIIEEISEAHYIAIFPHPTKVHTICSSSTVTILQGIYLIELPPSCEFKTSKESFINSQISIMEDPLTLPKIKTINIQNMAKVKPLKLDKIHLDELHKLTKEEENLQFVPIEEWDTGSNHYWVTPLYILLTLLVIFIGYKIWKSMKTNKRETRRRAIESEI